MNQERRGRPWSPAEDELAALAAGDMFSVLETASRLGRSSTATAARIAKLKATGRSGGFVLSPHIGASEFEDVIVSIEREGRSRLEAFVETKQLAEKFVEIGAYDWPERARTPHAPLPHPPTD